MGRGAAEKNTTAKEGTTSVNVVLQSAKDRQRTGIEKSETEFRDVEEKLE